MTTQQGSNPEASFPLVPSFWGRLWAPRPDPWLPKGLETWTLESDRHWSQPQPGHSLLWALGKLLHHLEPQVSPP